MALSKPIQNERCFPDVNEDEIKGMLKPKFKKKSALTLKNILNNFLREVDIASDLENCTMFLKSCTLLQGKVTEIFTK